MTNLNPTTIKPGLLVALKTSIRGNVTYRKNVIEAARLDADGVEHENWETERTVISPAELTMAKKARSKATSLIRSACTVTKFGLLCPQGNESELEAMLEAARRVVKDCNELANFSRVEVYTITGRVAADDIEAIRSINSEVRDLLDAMKQGVKDLDVEAIRKAANTARQLGDMLTPEANEKVKDAIAMARKAAKVIRKSGELAASAMNAELMKQLTDVQTVFLDLDETTEIKTPEVTDVAVDLMPESEGYESPSYIDDNGERSDGVYPGAAPQAPLEME
jgi:hypothetical protein